MVRILIIAACMFFMSIGLLAQEPPRFTRSASEEAVLQSGRGAGDGVLPIPLPAQSFRSNSRTRAPRTMEKSAASGAGVIASLSTGEQLFENEYLAFRIDPLGRAISRVSAERQLSPEALSALQSVPRWLEADLRLKFILLAAKKLDAAFAELILGAEDRYKDEIAFVIAHGSIQTLTDLRFAQDRPMLVRNAEMIYRYADSLRYMRLVEHGSVGSRDWHTTAAYRVYDSAAKDTVWSEIPRDIYYWYIVHPKMDQEGVYVRDNTNDNTGQRTYGYAWRDFVWNNPDPNRDYTQVNITTSKGTVSTIPRFGELMQRPTFLWDRKKGYLNFGRAFGAGQSALDMLGNWASRALPVDVVLPRAFQPNQILMKHNGMCNEDAFLVAAACRTALIPIVYLGCYAEDHVFGMIWDNGWHHFEFFRGGLAPAGNQFYGITNMLDRGSYGWKISMVEATRPDGYPMNFTEHYTSTCDVELRVQDSLGNPMEGAMVQIYAPYGNGYAVAERMYTGADGLLVFKAGEEKRYLVNAFHPLFGWSPVDSTRAYYMTQSNTVAGQRYTVNVPYANVKRMTGLPTVLPPTGTPSGAIRVSLQSQDIRSGVNVHDGQRSRFYARDSVGGGRLALALMDQDNYTAFAQGRQFTCLGFRPSMESGEWGMNLAMDRDYYLVLRNTAPANLVTDVKAVCELLDATISGTHPPETPELNLRISPNPVVSRCIFQADARIDEVEIVDLLGHRVAVFPGGEAWSPAPSLRNGVYFARVRIAGATRVRALTLVR